MNKKPFYLTTTLPYVNAAPHIGFALEIVQADTIARYKRMFGYEVIFNTGTDEHGSKIYEKAVAEGKDPQAYVDEYAVKFEELKTALNLSYTHFIRTTDTHHKAAAQEFWRLCMKRGDIYKKLYAVKYCVGCELEKTDSELVDGRCPIHPNRDVEVREEENYFFKFSAYKDKLLDLYDRYPDFVIPEYRFREIRSFVEAGLQDFSISRLKEKMPWGVPVPDDDAHVMYVWFDALVNYISTLGWPEDHTEFHKFWPGIQFAGKDNLRQQSAMWQAMLLSAGLPPTRNIIIHGFITSDGQKMSKSVGNVVDPYGLVEKYGTDAVRYWLLRELNPFEDGDFTIEKFEIRYGGDLANGLGNYAARVMTLGEKLGQFPKGSLDAGVEHAIHKARVLARAHLEEFKFHEALQAIWELVGFGDAYINTKKPWTGEAGSEDNRNTIYNAIVILDNLAALLQPFMPQTAEKITAGIQWASGHELLVTKIGNLFPRVDGPVKQ